MARIIPKLNLNRTPQVVDNYSLVAAKNIKLNKDNSFSRDIGITQINISEGLVGCISYNTKLYLFHSVSTSNGQNDSIIEYDETTGDLKSIKSGWHYSGGIIDGKVVVNLRGETLLIINEYFDEADPEIKIPIKTINLNTCSEDDDESIYTQTPKLQLFDLIHIGDYTEPIQAGVYTFFARYEIKDGFYTNWFPVSKPLYAGQKKLVHTIQGSVEYVDENVNCGMSFVFKVNRPIEEPAVLSYKYLQIGFILSRENEEVARTWKKFPINVERIYFDNNKNYIREIDINEFLKPIYNNYNVKNLVNFKHKTYISNYQETNADIDLSKFSSKFVIDIVNENITDQIYREYNGAKATIEDISVIIKNPEADYDGQDYTSKNINVITQLDEKSISNVFYDYYTKSPEVSNKVITNDGFLNIGSRKSFNIDFLDSNIAGTWNASQMSSYTNALDSCIYQLFSSTNTQTGIIELATNKDYGHYFPQTEISRDYLSNNIDYNLEPKVDHDIKLWYINEIVLYFPDNQDGIDLIKLHNSYYESNKNQKGYFGCWAKDINKTILDILNIYIYGITDNDEVILKIPSIENDTIVDKYYKYKKEVCGISVSYTCVDGSYYFHPSLNEAGTQWGYSCSLSLSNCYWRYQELELKPNNNLFNNLTNLCKTNITTFIPEQNYNFYLHFIKNTGEVTNGYYITSKTINAVENINSIISHNVFYPSITNNLTDDDKEKLHKLKYNCYFISAIKNNTTIECTNKQCLEFDLLLNRSDKVKVTSIDEYGTIVEENGYYMDDTGNTLVTENTNTNLSYFGSGGYLEYHSYWNPYSFIKNLYELYEKQVNLIKVTPYTNINESINASYSHFNCLGYIVYYRKPNENDLEYYISGGNVFEKTIENQVIQLEELKQSFSITSTNEISIYSNYNLNFLRLSISIQEQIRMYEGKDGSNKREFTKFINSLNLKDLYSLSSSYKDYTTYNYTNHNPINSKYIFDNTIRGSQLTGDEANNYIITFNALDYYNVPTNKGIITKLAGIGDTMLVHTQDSIFEFSGKPSIASDSAAQIVETDIFDSGITEVIPSEYGMAGLQHKNHAIVTPFGYVFWDAQLNTIYYYAGKGQISPISDPIRKILDNFNPDNVIFSYDYVNDRFFITFKKYSDAVTLSYNIKAKAFISFHTVSYDYSVNTKNKTYYINNDMLGVLDSKSKTYGNFYSYCLYAIHNSTDETDINSYIDVIVNNDYEKIKVLDSITWICSKITTLKQLPKYNYNLAEDVSESLYPGNDLLIYTDTCHSNLITLQDENLKLLKDYTKGDYKAPVYNLGKFTLNYFRNEKDTKAIEKSLIYGKYFCIRFFFDKCAHTNEVEDFKLENIELLYTIENYGKI